MSERLSLRLAALVAAASLTACQRPLSTDECNALLDHYTELLVKKQDPHASDNDLATARRKARAKASASRDFARCATKVSRRQYACAMAAPTVDDVERCLL